METKLGKVGLIGRFKPLHNGNSALLESACENSNAVLIGIGSSNKYDLRNPFTAKESEEMIRAILFPRFSNYSFIYIPDFGNDKKWKNEIIEQFKNLDYFVSGNAYVAEILKDTYKIMHPFDLVPQYRQSKLNSSKVRIEIARNGNWKELVPGVVGKYLEKNKLLERFREEFGKQTLEYLDNKFHRTAEEEKKRILNSVAI